MDRPDSKALSLVVVATALVAFAILWLARSAGQPREVDGSTDDFGWLAALREGRDVQLENESSRRKLMTIRGSDHEDIPESVVDGVLRTAQYKAKSTNAYLAKFYETMDSQNLADLAEEAEILYDKVKYESIVRAVEEGDFFFAGTAAFPPKIDGAITHLRSGSSEHGNVVFVLKHEKYPDVLNAEVYKEEAAWHRDKQLVEQWNAQPYEHRKQLIERHFAARAELSRIRGLRRDGELTQDQYGEIYRRIKDSMLYDKIPGKPDRNGFVVVLREPPVHR